MEVIHLKRARYDYEMFPLTVLYCTANHDPVVLNVTFVHNYKLLYVLQYRYGQFLY